ncbi:MAG: hypothetical protein KKH62_08165 [Gammaproteobacteria bacterium]|nr:hypothetical protein [Gammaproteobacteria bacterium]
MSDARLMQILASLARRSPLRTLHTICETQHKISTRKLEQYLEPIGDELAGFAFNLRQDYDQLRTANQRLALDNEDLLDKYDKAWRRAGMAEGNVQALLAANQRLEGEVNRLRLALTLAANRLDRLTLELPGGYWREESAEWTSQARAALSTANGEVTK